VIVIIIIQGKPICPLQILQFLLIQLNLGMWNFSLELTLSFNVVTLYWKTPLRMIKCF